MAVEKEIKFRRNMKKWRIREYILSILFLLFIASSPSNSSGNEWDKARDKTHWFEFDEIRVCHIVESLMDPEIAPILFPKCKKNEDSRPSYEVKEQTEVNRQVALLKTYKNFITTVLSQEPEFSEREKKDLQELENRIGDIGDFVLRHLPLSASIAFRIKRNDSNFYILSDYYKDRCLELPSLRNFELMVPKILFAENKSYKYCQFWEKYKQDRMWKKEIIEIYLNALLKIKWSSEIKNPDLFIQSWLEKLIQNQTVRIVPKEMVGDKIHKILISESQVFFSNSQTVDKLNGDIIKQLLEFINFVDKADLKNEKTFELDVFRELNSEQKQYVLSLISKT